jgi:hypothetical protein
MMRWSEDRILKTRQLIENKTIQELYSILRYTSWDMMLAAEKKYGVHPIGDIVEERIVEHMILGASDE